MWALDIPSPSSSAASCPRGGSLSRRKIELVLIFWFGSSPLDVGSVDLGSFRIVRCTLGRTGYPVSAALSKAQDKR